MKNIKLYAVILLSLLSITAFSQEKKNIKTETFIVSGNCEMCKKRIESSLDVKGVKEAAWDDKTKLLTVTFNEKKITLEQIYKDIAAAGYDTEKQKADNKAYSSLPACCKYERKK